jgi:hypothetical protein
MNMVLILFMFNFIFTSCEDEFNSELGNKYVEADLINDVLSIQNEIETNTIPTSDQVTEYLDKQLSGPTSPLCSQGTKQIKSKRVIREVSDQDQTGEEEEVSEGEQGNPIEMKLKENFSKLGGTSVALDQALCFFNKNKDKKFERKLYGKYTGSTSIKNKDYMVIQDLTLRGNQKRFFLLNMKTGEIETMYSAVGYGTSGLKGKGQNRENSADYFSNNEGSYLTPRGFMVTDNKKEKSELAWKWKLRYDGLQKDLNDNSRDRAIIFHQGVESENFNKKTITPGLTSSREDYPELIMKDKNGNQTNKWKNPQHYSNGCTTIATENVDYVYEKIKGRSLSYNFTKYEKELGETYCGDDSMVKNND